MFSSTNSDMSFEEETYSVGTKNKVPITSGQIPKISTRYGKVDFFFCYYYPTAYGKIKIDLDHFGSCININCAFVYSILYR